MLGPITAIACRVARTGVPCKPLVVNRLGVACVGSFATLPRITIHGLLMAVILRR